MTTPAQAIQHYIVHEILRDPTFDLTPDTPLVSSGLLDSFALVDILITVEEVTGRKLPAGELTAQDLDTIHAMLAVADRLGKPRA